MPILREAPVPSDSRRDADKHYRLLLALNRATGEIRDMERAGHPDIDEVLDRLLPDLSGALNAEQAFVVVLREDEGKGNKWFELTAVYPRKDLRGHYLEWSDLLQQLIKDGKPRVIDPLGEARVPIPGLEIFDATSAVLVRMQAADYVRVVGICNKAHPDLGPYLAADGMALDNIVELVAIGARVGERRRRELETIQETSAAISSSLDLQKVLGTIADSIMQVTGCQKSAIFLVDKKRNELNVEMAQGLSKEYLLNSRSLKIGPKTRAAVIFDGAPITVADIEVEPRFNVFKELAHQEGFRAFIDVPMNTKEETIGAITAYYTQPHDFSKEEIDLLTTFANQAAIAVQNATQYETLRQAQEDLVAATTVAWLGISGAEWSHAVNQKTSAIYYNVNTLRDLIHSPDEVSQEILDDIERAAREIQNIPMKGPLPAQTGEPVSPIVVDEVLQEWLPRWCKARTDVELNLQLCCGHEFAYIDDTWLAIALEKLVSNALKAMLNGGRLTVASRVINDDRLEIIVEDTGYGVPEKALVYFLRKRVPPEARRDRLGSGMGALIARFILRSYGGDLELLRTGEGEGTVLRVLLPVARKFP